MATTCNNNQLCIALVENLRRGVVLSYSDDDHPFVVVLKNGNNPLVVLNYCPWCGVELNTIIESYPVERYPPRLPKPTDDIVH